MVRLWVALVPFFHKTWSDERLSVITMGMDCNQLIAVSKQAESNNIQVGD